MTRERSRRPMSGPKPSGLVTALVSLCVLVVACAVPILIELGLMALHVPIPEWIIAPAFIVIFCTVYTLFKLSPLGRFVWSLPPYGF